MSSSWSASLVGKDSAPAAGSTAFKIADANADSSIDITDVITQVNQILGISPKLIAKGPSAPVVVTLGVPEADADGQLMMPLVVTSNGVIAGMQATLVFDPSQVQVEAPIISGHSAGLGLDYHITDGTLRLVVYSLKPGQGLSAGMGTVVHIPVNPLADGARLTITQVRMGDPQAQFVTTLVPTPSVVVPVKDTNLPAVFSLSIARPNPFNPSTTIAYEVPQQAQVTLTVYNLLGQEVTRLVDSVKQPFVAIRRSGPGPTRPAGL